MNEFMGRLIWLAGRFRDRPMVVLMLLLLLLVLLTPMLALLLDDNELEVVNVDEFVLHEDIVEQVVLAELDSDEGDVDKRVAVVSDEAFVSFDE